MAKETVQLVYFFILILAAAILTGLVFLPYLPAIMMAVVLAIVFWPVHRDLLSSVKNREFLAALLSTAFVLVVIVIPVLIFSTLLFKEVARIYGELSADPVHLDGVMNQAMEWVTTWWPAAGEYLGQVLTGFDPDQYIAQAIQWMFKTSNTVFTHTFHLIIAGAISVLALFYLFKDGRRAVEYFKKVSPLETGYEDTILQKIETAINSVIRGRVLIALIQGLLTGLALALVGIPAPILWSGVTAVLSVIPMLGPGLVITPAAIFLFYTGQVWSAVFLLAVAVGAIYFVDDILAPLLIRRGMHIHPFLILIAILGGIGVFGPMGFVAGPVVLALFFALLEIYPTVLARYRTG